MEVLFFLAFLIFLVSIIMVPFRISSILDELKEIRKILEDK